MKESHPVDCTFVLTIESIGLVFCARTSYIEVCTCSACMFRRLHHVPILHASLSLAALQYECASADLAIELANVLI